MLLYILESPTETTALKLFNSLGETSSMLVIKPQCEELIDFELAISSIILKRLEKQSESRL